MTLHISEIGVTMAVGGGAPPSERDNGVGGPGGGESCCEVNLSAAQRESIIEDVVQRVLAAVRRAEAR